MEWGCEYKFVNGYLIYAKRRDKPAVVEKFSIMLFA